MLKHFTVDKRRDRLVVSVEFYQMNLIKAVEQARRLDPELFKDGDDYLPSWTKFAKDPIKAKGFWTRMLQAVFLGQGNIPELNVDLQTRDLAADGFKVSMMFLPGSMRNENLKTVVALTMQILKGWKVLEISGVGDHNGQKINNRNAEKITKEVIEDCREKNIPLLILSRGMAQRSYSIGDITELYLCYDEGDAGATTQKISRALTPSSQGKIGRIFSLSFDPNRDDKFDTMLIASAQNYAARKGIDSDQALRKVINTIDLFACGEDGRIEINHDTYLQQILERSSLSRMLGKQADLSSLSMKEIVEYAEANSNYSKLSRTESADKGRAGDSKSKAKKSNLSPNQQLQMIDKARKTLTTIVEHLPYLAIMTKSESIKESLQKCDQNRDYRDYVIQEFGVAPDRILNLFERRVLNYDLASLQKSARVLQLTTN